MSDSRVLLLRADASREIGIGHVMRCLALAQAWQDAGGKAYLLSSRLPPPTAERLRHDGIETTDLASRPGSNEDARETRDRAVALNATWIAADGYHFGSSYQEAVKDRAPRLLVFDDFGHADEYVADVVLNQNLYADESMYSKRSAGTELLLGPEYVQLRREFRFWCGWKRTPHPGVKRILVTFGGADVKPASVLALQALQRLSGLAALADVLIGPASEARETIERLGENSPFPIRFISNSGSVASIFRAADLAVAAAGTTALELSFLGVPALLMVLAENQRRVAESLAKEGMAIDLGRVENLSPSVLAGALEALLSESASLRIMAARGQERIDGGGTVRLVRHLGLDMPAFRLASEGDCELLWNWVNAPEVRAASFVTNPIPWEEHRRWFTEKLNDPDCFILIPVAASGDALGQVRFERHGEEADISISLDRTFRDKGLGSCIIPQACRLFRDSSGVKAIYAFVRTGNEASRRAFKKGGFLEAGHVSVKGQAAEQLVFAGA